ncbi:MAG: histidinol dehydrogenase [Gemmataceae bacterium]
MIRRIDFHQPGGPAALQQFQAELSNSGQVVSPRSQALTRQVFGADLTPIQVVERICGEVKQRGQAAVFDYTQRFDGVTLTPQTLRVSEAELVAAHAQADPGLLETVRRIRANVLAYQTHILHRDTSLPVEGGLLQLRYRPVRRVGVLVPGGAAAYPSTLLMTIVPAQAAGVRELAVVMPPGPHGAGNPVLLAVCQELGAREIYRIGGAQAVAALAYGIDGLAAVDMIVGPGNLFVALAKRHVYGQVAIDCIAGPSEVVVLADDTARPEFLAADLLAQAEHSPGCSIMVTWHAPLLDAVAAELDRQLAQLSRAEWTRDALAQFGAFVLTRNQAEAVAVVNQLAPEHLEICTADPEGIVAQIDHAGAIFLGPYSPVAVGDYAAGPSHVLPTGATARFASGLSANEFLRRSSVIRFDREGLARLAADVERLAKLEGLTAHAASVTCRFGKGGET